MTTAVAMDNIQRALQAFDFKRLFIEELAWNAYRGMPQVAQVGGETYTLRTVAEKVGMAALLCEPDVRGGIPDYKTRKAIEAQVTKLAHEHMIIYVDRGETRQIWQWVKRQPGRPNAYREWTFTKGQTGEALAQRLRELVIPLKEEERLTLPDVTDKAKRAFDVERVTKRFYDRFKTEHAAFLKLIAGIADEEQREWYASLMLNRLMFTYFVQKKGFLANDTDYLRTRLGQVQARYGSGNFHTFYRDFLLRFFHEGLGLPKEQRTPDLAALIGDIPYVNGGLFELHQIEAANRSIAIPDEAFEKVFDFFDDYNWHLDDRPLHADNEINPDVLGYIFEKYINQKQMGAYYTKEDITGYIGRNTILPYLFDAARKDCPIAFVPDGEVWRLLRDDPDRYIYEAVRKGVDEPLPEEIAAGVDDVAKRGGWNRPAPEQYALPTETWREHVARRTRCLDLRAKLAAGEVTQINDLITYNLDIERFALDVINFCEGPELLRAFWKALTTITILDPTCGSGAFLFAALSILEPLYEACLERMESFVTDFDRHEQTQKGPDFREALRHIKEHPNRRYFILKTIIVNNLYGVDIMAEACEIAKLRLFLKLVAQVQDAKKLEPLPDIDFNIRAGNTLIGFATYEEAEAAVSGNLIWHSEMPQIAVQAADLDRLVAHFRAQQTTHGGEITLANKEELRLRLAKLGNILDRFLAAEYGIDEHHYPNKAEYDERIAAWRKSHQPFHWFTEFSGIVQGSKGFDVIVGNPPYVELHTVKNYNVQNYVTQPAGNLYPLVIERSLTLANKQGRVGFIVPVSSISTGGYGSLQRLLANYSAHFSSYNDRPSRLFDGLEHIRLTIQIIQKRQRDRQVSFSTECYKWSAVERPFLFERLQYQEVTSSYLSCSLPKISRYVEGSILDKVWEDKHSIEEHLRSVGNWSLYYSRKMSAFLQVLNFVPEMYDGNGAKRLPSELKELRFAGREEAEVVLSLLNSTLFRWLVNVFSDFRNLNRREVVGMRLDINRAVQNNVEEFAMLARQLSHRLNETSEMREMRFKDSTLRVQCIIPKHAKSIIDDIDRVLAKHYGFTDEELDFIINYDIKYRMGQDNGDEGENGNGEE